MVLNRRFSTIFAEWKPIDTTVDQVVVDRLFFFMSGATGIEDIEKRDRIDNKAPTLGG